jgi:hypothetical protein
MDACEEALRFAGESWPAFLPCAHEGLGRLLYNAVEFVADWLGELEGGCCHTLGRVLLRRGTWLRARIQPRVVETSQGSAEVADLLFEDGTAVCGVPFAAFVFAD